MGDRFTHDGVVDFSKLFLVPTAMGLIAAAVLFIGFHPEKTVPRAEVAAA